MTEAQKLQIKASEQRARLNELSSVESVTDEQRAELDTLTTEYQDTERRWRAAALSEDQAVEIRETQTVDAETRERNELRGGSLLVNYVRAALRGRDVDGAEAEYRAACHVDHGIPLALLGEVETRADAVSESPSTVGVQMHPVQPMLFAPSIASTLGIDMPSQSSGTFATSTITTALTAGTKAKGGAAESTAAAMTVSTSTVKRISGRLSVREEDIATVGAANFEVALRQNMTAVMSDAFDSQALTGDGQGGYGPGQPAHYRGTRVCQRPEPTAENGSRSKRCAARNSSTKP